MIAFTEFIGDTNIFTVYLGHKYTLGIPYEGIPQNDIIM